MAERSRWESWGPGGQRKEQNRFVELDTKFGSFGIGVIDMISKVGLLPSKTNVVVDVSVHAKRSRDIPEED